ncbi:uncharacterized protein PYUK71.03c-like isoform X2 [Haliotis rufescens]|uniref:uncharacterized protein PYUK71.03c-like isoform X2 n=1 Tax=Haliotis rufescens TaxID=6454 RepID=UPI00201F9DB6|nr:uncharacterized protein PYUK71.03c-like isoform X2 [Haliotis rufescens]
MATKVANGDVKNVDIKAARDGQKEAVTSLTGMYILVAALVAIAWGLGCYGCSFLWVFFLVSCLFVIWRAKISRIIKRHLDFEEATLHRKRALRQSETVEWLNFLLNRWWVFSSSTIEDLVKKRLDDRLLAIKPTFLESLALTTFNVGEQTPHIRNVRVFEFSEGVPGGHKPCTWFSVNQPPKGLDNMSTYQVVVESDVTMQCEDFKMIFRGRVGSKRVNVGFDMVIQELVLSGTVQAIIQFSMDVPFPHIAKATVCFTEKPDVTFNISLLRAIQMMEVPLLKSWIHTNVMESLTKALVDPASVDIHFAKIGPIQINRGKPKKNAAEGVLTIQLKGVPVKGAASDEIRYSVLRVGENKRETLEVPASEEWEDVCSFFIYSLSNEKLQIKNKCKRLLTSTVLEKHECYLSSFPFKVREFADKEIKNKDGSLLSMKMQYTALPALNLETLLESKRDKVTETAGVMYICIHGAVNVLVADKNGASDPYCVLFCDRRRVLTTPYIPHTRNPRWESSVEFFVSDYTKSSLSFFVFDWDGTNVIDDDFLGSTHLQLSTEETCIVKKTLTLGYNKPSEGYVVDKSCGMITVSVVFRPVSSVAKSEKFRQLTESINNTDFLYNEDMVSPASVNMAYLRLPKREDDQAARASTSASAYIEEYLEGKTIVELTLLQAKDLVAMDRNGYSDPFCVVLKNGKKVFTTGVKKKTLFPKWNETVTVELEGDDAMLTIEMYDNDMIGKDFMGKIPLTVEKLKELSVKGTADWFPLQRTKSGKLQLKCQVTCKDNMKNKDATDSLKNDVFDSPPESPVKPVLPDMVVDDTYLNSVHLPSNTLMASSPQQGPIKRLSTTMPAAQIRRSNSDLTNSTNSNRLQGRRGTQSFNMYRKDSLTLQPPGMRPSESINSLAVLPKSPGDNVSLTSSAHDTTLDSSICGDKLYSVKGKVMQARGLDRVDGDFYCKVRLEHQSRSSRLKLFSNTRVIAKSPMIRSSHPDINLTFEVDRGHGVSSEDLLIFDVKQSSKDHLATKGFPLKDLLADCDASGVVTWLKLENGIDVEISLSSGAPSPTHQRRSARILKSLSFRRDK